MAFEEVSLLADGETLVVLFKLLKFFRPKLVAALGGASDGAWVPAAKKAYWNCLGGVASAPKVSRFTPKSNLRAGPTMLLVDEANLVPDPAASC